MQIPATQTWLTQRVVDAVSNKINGSIDVGKVYIVFFNRLVLNDVSISEKINRYNDYRDTLVKCENLAITLSPLELIQGNIKVKTISLGNGVFNLQNQVGGESNLNRIFKSNNSQNDTLKSNKPLDISARSVKIKDFRFIMVTTDTVTNTIVNQGYDSRCINFSDLDVGSINININSVSLKNDTLRANISNISAKEKSGFNLKRLEGQLTVTPNIAQIKNLILEDDYSNISANYLAFEYKSSADFSDFINKVTLSADFNSTFLNFGTIGSFTPSLLNSSLSFYINGKVKGRIKNLKTDNLKIYSETGLTFMKLNAHISGLPDVPATMANIKIEECYTTSNDIANIISSINNTPKIQFFSKLAPFIRYNFTASLNGLLYDFVVNGKLQSSIGDVDMDVLVNASPQQRDNGIIIDGYIQTNELDIGKLISNELLGSATLNGSVLTTIKDEESGGVNVNLKSMRISKLGFYGYDYRNIIATGTYNSKSFDGKIICHDPNLDFIFQGLFTLDMSKTRKYDFYLDLPYANLHELNIDKRDEISEIGMITTANFTQTTSNDITGEIDIKQPYFKNSKGEFNLGEISLKSISEAHKTSASLKSQFINAQYNGNIPLSTFVNDFVNSTFKETVSNYINYDDSFGDSSGNRDENGNDNNNGNNFNGNNRDNGNSSSNSNNNGSNNKSRNNNSNSSNGKNYNGVAANDTTISKKGDLSIYVNDIKGLCEAIMPQLYVAPNSTIIVHRDNNLNRINIKSDAIAYDKNLVSRLKLDIDKRDSTISSMLNADKLIIKGLRLDSTILKIDGVNNNLNCRLSFAGDSSRTNALINSNIVLTNRNNYKCASLFLDSSYFKINNERWTLSAPEIAYYDSTLFVDSFMLYHKDQNLNVHGILSQVESDTLNIDLNRFNIGFLNNLTKQDFNLKGYLSGTGNIFYKNKKQNINLVLGGDSIYVAHHELGSINAYCNWDNDDKRINIDVSNRLKGTSPLTAKGWFKPDSSEIDLNVNLNGFTPNYFEPFLAGVISNMNGSVSGDLKLKGSLNKPELYGNGVVLNNLGFTVDFLNVPYTVSGPVNISPKGILVQNADIKDNKGGSGDVNGGLKYDHFKDITLDTKISFNNLMALNTKDSDDAAFYGTAFASGNVSIKGAFDKIKLGIDGRTNNNTLIHIPLSNASTAAQTNILTFAEPARKDKGVPLDSLIASALPKQGNSQMDIDLRLNVTPDAEIFIEINKEVGDVIKANGTGLINMQISPWRDIFNMFGDYRINQGSYKFVVLGLAAKDFTIQPGGMINFNGGIENTNLNLSAIYKTKASINPLIADTGTVSTRRVVECVLGMNGRLMNPELSFNINIPDLDPTVKALVESALSIEGQVQKQFMALLVSGGFIPNEQSGIANNSTILYSNASEILSNQLNNILQQLGIPIDLGLNYARGDNGTNVFDVAISTSLFNNRVIVSGNMGNDPSNLTDRDVIGNFDVEIKLDKQGRLRLNLFSHATDLYSNSLDYSQRNGIGIVYQQGFDSFRHLFRRRSKHERDMEMQIREHEKSIREEKKK